MTRVLVTGSRYYRNVPHLWCTLDGLHDDRGISLVIEGWSDLLTGPYQGADYWANQWARSRRVGQQREPADWGKYGRGAGPVRNQLMIDAYYPDLVVAFNGGFGTADQVRRARKAGLEVIEVEEPA